MDAIRDIVSITADNGGGTFETGTLIPFEPTRGFAVAAANGALVRDVTAVREAARRVGQEWATSYVGTWLRDDGLVAVDPVLYIVDRDRALREGRARGQDAIYDFGSQEVIVL